jgi:Fe2+ or Zn2+ uptake regulation protein
MVIKPDDPRRQLELFPRDIEGQSVNIRLNFENHSWALDLTEEQAQAQQKRKTLRQRLWDILENHPQGLSGKQIQELLDGDEPVSNGSVYTTLNRMEDKKLISTTPAPGNQRYTIYYIKS